MKTLTVVKIEDWSILFDGENVVQQNHTTEVDDIVRAANGEPFYLKYVSAYDSQFDKMVCELGEVSADAKLSDILPLTVRGRRR